MLSRDAAMAWYRRNRQRSEALFDLLATGLFIAALFHMPLPNVTAVMQAVPITATLMTMIVFKERVEAWQLGAIVVGLIGVLLIIKPGTSGFNPAVVLAAEIGRASCRERVYGLV